MNVESGQMWEEMVVPYFKLLIYYLDRLRKTMEILSQDILSLIRIYIGKG